MGVWDKISNICQSANPLTVLFGCRFVSNFTLDRRPSIHTLRLTVRGVCETAGRLWWNFLAVKRGASDVYKSLVMEHLFTDSEVDDFQTIHTV